MNIKLSIYFTISIIFLFHLELFSQPEIEWEKSLGGTGEERTESIQQTVDGGFIVAGYTDSGSNDGDVSINYGDRDYWIVKLDPSGNIEWEKSLGGFGYDSANSIQQTIDGGFIVAGSSGSNDGHVSTNHGLLDCWIVKLNPSGNIEWEKSLGGSGYDRTYSIQQTIDGGFIVAGYSESNDGDVSTNYGSFDYWIVKLDPVGNIEWEKSLGGTGEEITNSIQQTIDGGFIVAGYSESNDGDVSTNYGSFDYWIVKLDPVGNIEWEKSLGGTDEDLANSIQQTIDGGYIVAGTSRSNNGDVSSNNGFFDCWIVKLDPVGNIEWEKNLGGTGFESANSIQQTIDGGYIIAGSSGSNDGDVSSNNGDRDYWIVKLDPFSNIEWEKNLGGTSFERATFIQQTINGGFIVAGNSESNNGDVGTNHGASNDYWIVKLTFIVSNTNVFSENIPYVQIYPNPTDGNVFITLESVNEPVNITIQNLLGQYVYQSKNINQSIQVKQQLPKGIYWVNIFDEKWFLTKQLIVH